MAVDNSTEIGIDTNRDKDLSNAIGNLTDSVNMTSLLSAGKGSNSVIKATLLKNSINFIKDFNNDKLVTAEKLSKVDIPSELEIGPDLYNADDDTLRKTVRRVRKLTRGNVRKYYNEIMYHDGGENGKDGKGGVSTRDKLVFYKREQIAYSRYKTNLTLFNAINRNVEYTNKFHTNVTSKYYKKSLELQYMHLFTSQTQLNVIKTGFNAFKDQLEAIVNNTSIPDTMKRVSTVGGAIEEYYKEERIKLIQNVYRTFEDGAMDAGVRGLKSIWDTKKRKDEVTGKNVGKESKLKKKLEKENLDNITNERIINNRNSSWRDNLAGSVASFTKGAIYGDDEKSDIANAIAEYTKDVETHKLLTKIYDRMLNYSTYTVGGGSTTTKSEPVDKEETTVPKSKTVNTPKAKATKKAKAVKEKFFKKKASYTKKEDTPKAEEGEEDTINDFINDAKEQMSETIESTKSKFKDKKSDFTKKVNSKLSGLEKQLSSSRKLDRLLWVGSAKALAKAPKTMLKGISTLFKGLGKTAKFAGSTAKTMFTPIRDSEFEDDMVVPNYNKNKAKPSMDQATTDEENENLKTATPEEEETLKESFFKSKAYLTGKIKSFNEYKKGLGFKINTEKSWLFSTINNKASSFATEHKNKILDFVKERLNPTLTTISLEQERELRAGFFKSEEYTSGSVRDFHEYLHALGFRSSIDYQKKTRSFLKKTRELDRKIWVKSMKGIAKAPKTAYKGAKLAANSLKFLLKATGTTLKTLFSPVKSYKKRKREKIAAARKEKWTSRLKRILIHGEKVNGEKNKVHTFVRNHKKLSIAAGLMGLLFLGKKLGVTMDSVTGFVKGAASGIKSMFHILEDMFDVGKKTYDVLASIYGYITDNPVTNSISSVYHSIAGKSKKDKKSLAANNANYDPNAAEQSGEHAGKAVTYGVAGGIALYGGRKLYNVGKSATKAVAATYGVGKKGASKVAEHMAARKATASMATKVAEEKATKTAGKRASSRAARKAANAAARKIVAKKVVNKVAAKSVEKAVKRSAIRIFLTKLRTTIIKKVGVKIGAELLGKIATRFVPFLGWAMLAYDAVKISYYMLHDHMPFANAVSFQILGMDIFSDKWDSKDDITPVGNTSIPKGTVGKGMKYKNANNALGVNKYANSKIANNILGRDGKPLAVDPFTGAVLPQADSSSSFGSTTANDANNKHSAAAIRNRTIIDNANALTNKHSEARANIDLNKVVKPLHAHIHIAKDSNTKLSNISSLLDQSLQMHAETVSLLTAIVNQGKEAKEEISKKDASSNRAANNPKYNEDLPAPAINLNRRNF